MLQLVSLFRHQCRPLSIYQSENIVLKIYNQLILNIKIINLKCGIKNASVFLVKYYF